MQKSTLPTVKVVVAGAPELPSIWQLYSPESSSNAVNVSVERVPASLILRLPLDRLVLPGGTAQVKLYGGLPPNATHPRVTVSPYVYTDGWFKKFAVL